MKKAVMNLIIMAVNIIKRLCGLKCIRYRYRKKNSKYIIETKGVYTIDELCINDTTYFYEFRAIICILWLCGIQVRKTHLCVIAGSSGHKHAGSVNEKQSNFDNCEVNKTLFKEYFKGSWESFRKTIKKTFKPECLDEVREFARKNDDTLLEWASHVERRYRDLIF